jgi:hypothetical protein
MRKLNALVGLGRAIFVGGEVRMRRNRRRHVQLDVLEDRSLLSTAAAPVQLVGQTVQIMADKASGNDAQIQINPNNSSQLEVTLNGQNYDFSLSQVQAVVYIGGAQGHDTVTNGTSLEFIADAFGGGNTITGGTGTDYIFAWGDNTTVNDQGGGNVIFTHGGRNDNVQQTPGTLVFTF